jgi:hypothetical protein
MPEETGDGGRRVGADANAALEQAGAAFCAEAKDYIIAIDRYGKIFTEQAATW